jgi:hypothetical protein
MGQKLVTGRDVDECDRIEFRMDFSFHGEMPSSKIGAVWRSLVLPGQVCPDQFSPDVL